LLSTTLAKVLKSWQ